MKLFILMIVAIAIYTFLKKEDGLLASVKAVRKYNKDIEQKIKNGCKKKMYNLEYYSEEDYRSISCDLLKYICINLAGTILSATLVLLLSGVVIVCSPIKETYYSFDINSLNDNLITSGKFESRMYCTSGSINGEISYFFSRTMNRGDVIGHIPAGNSYIKYDNNTEPRIEVHQKSYNVPKIADKFLFTKKINKKVTDYYVIIVPEGTISTTGTYEIDMQ